MTPIPRSHNHAGYPQGVVGADLLENMADQARRYGADLRRGEVTGLRRDGRLFTAQTDAGPITARTVLLATGVVNNRPEGMDDQFHAEALGRGLLRYCPVCDGYEVTDKRVAVIGTADHGTAEAQFIRTYTADLTLVSPHGDHDLSAQCSQALDEAGIARVAGPCSGYAIENGRIAFDTGAGRLAFDSIYPALGSLVRSGLAVSCGAEVSEQDCVLVDNHLETSVPGLFAAGDVVIGLDQISHAMGQAGVAATTIRNHLARERPLRR